MVEVSSAGGAVLAGGRSVRFGSRKELAEVGGRTILDRVLDAHGAVFDHVVVVTSGTATLTSRQVATTEDLYPGAGPLAGVHAALRWAERRDLAGVCCSPCDAPFIEPTLFQLLLGSAGDAEAVIPRSGGPLGYEPLFGWYSTRITRVLETFLASGGRAAHDFIGGLNGARFLSIDGTAVTTPAEKLFMNVNTVEDLELARGWAREEGTG